MIIYRQKLFFSEEFYKKWERKGRRARRAAFYKTAADSAIGGVKNAGLQTIDAVKHPLSTTKNVALGVGNKVKNSYVSLGATFGIGKKAKELTTSERIRRQAHFWSPTARKAINIHDFTAHTLGKNGNSWVDSMARFKHTPISYVGRKSDELIRTGAVGMASGLSNKFGAANIASGLDKAQSVAGGKWAGFNADQVAGLVGKTSSQLSSTSRGAINLAGKASGYTTGERPSGLLEEIGKAITKGKEPELAKQIETFKNTKQARRAAEHIDRNKIVQAANKVANADRQLWKGVGQGINTGASKIKSGAKSVLSGIGGMLGKKPALVK